MVLEKRQEEAELIHNEVIQLNIEE